MSRIENITIKIKNAKVKNIENICLCFSEDLTAIQTAKKLGISRQTVNQYYKTLREKLFEEFFFINKYILDEVVKKDRFCIKQFNIYKEDIFYISYEESILLLNDNSSLPLYFKEFIDTKLKDALSKHKKANCARVLLNTRTKSLLVSGYFKQNDCSFEEFVEARLKQFRGIGKDKLFSYIKESQIRYIFSSQTIYEKLLLSFK